MSLVRGIMSCGCVFRREAAGFSAPGPVEHADDRKLVTVGDKLWCQNHYASVVLEELDPVEANGAAA